MAKVFAALVAGAIDRLVRWVVIPITGAIPLLLEHGVLLTVFAVLWLAFGGAVLADPAALASAWASVGQLPLPVQGIAWLLFLPLMAGMWIWSTDWAVAVRIVLVAGVAVWNLLVFIPRREAATPVAAVS